MTAGQALPLHHSARKTYDNGLDAVLKYPTRESTMCAANALPKMEIIMPLGGDELGAKRYVKRLVPPPPTRAGFNEP